MYSLTLLKNMNTGENWIRNLEDKLKNSQNNKKKECIENYRREYNRHGGLIASTYEKLTFLETRQRQMQKM